MLKDLLLISNPKVMGLCEYLNQSALLFILPAFYLAIVFEFFNQLDFQSIAKRAFIAFIAINILTGFHTKAVSLSLETSSSLISKYSPNNKFLFAYQIAKGDSGSLDKEGVWAKLTSIVELLVDDQINLIYFLNKLFCLFSFNSAF